MSKNFFIVILCVIAFWTLVRGITGLWSANIEQDIFISMKKSKLSEERGPYWKNKSYVMQYSNEKYGFDFLYPSDYCAQNYERGGIFWRKDDKGYIAILVTPFYDRKIFSAWQLRQDSLDAEKVIFDFGERKEALREVFVKNGYWCVQYIFLHQKNEYCIGIFRREEGVQADEALAKREFIGYAEQIFADFRLRK